MRIAIGGFVHETNSYGSVPVTMEVLEEHTCEGQRFAGVYQNSNSYVAGFQDAARELGVELVYTRMSSMLPSGPCVKEGFELSRDRIVMLTRQAHEEKPLDGICLFLHGAGAAEGYPDVEGEILQALRNALGNEIPIAVVQDLHGNISREMAALSDIMVGCKCYPHTDTRETGYRTFTTLVQSIRQGYRPCQHLIRLPWHMVPAQGTTLEGPAAKVRQLTRELEKDEVLHVSFFHGFPYADVACAGASVITVAKNPQAAKKAAQEVARYVWAHLPDFAMELNSAREAVEKALQAPQKPALIHESSDNPGGGTPGDGTFLLRELLKVNVPSAFSYISDPEVAQQAAKAGVGAKISCVLGGKRDAYHGEPIRLTDAYVKCVSDGYFVRKNPMGKGTKDCMGTTVCLQVGNVSIVVASSRFQGYDDGVFYTAGIDWTQMQILAIKSAQHFKGFWADRPVTIIPCDSPGIQTADLTQLPMEHVDRSYYPLGNPVFEV